MRVARLGFVIRLAPGARDEYLRLHRTVWPDVLVALSKSQIRNYSIFLRSLTDGRDWLFASFDYVGVDYPSDMARLASDPATQSWWNLTAPLQDPLPDRPAGTWWAPMDEVFRFDGPHSEGTV